MVLFYLVSSLKWPTVPIILSGSLSLAPRILSGELWCLSCVQGAFSALVPNSPHCTAVSPQEHHSSHHSHTLNGEIRFAEGEGQNTRHAGVKQTSNESGGFDGKCWWKADGHSWRLQDEGGKLRGLKLDCWAEPPPAPGKATGPSASYKAYIIMTQAAAASEYDTDFGRWFMMLWQFNMCQHLLY